jgi:phenylpropionate dioxygenase-like ring-hydroxylating dioxygenase large terminal subunit
MMNMFVKDAWYVAGWGHEVGAKPFSRTLLGEPVCMYRDTHGVIVALADRCAHRAAPLSVGRIEGDEVRCMYHGLKFDRAGQCVEVPGQERVPPKLCVRRYAVVERNNWIWIWMGNAAKADPLQIPDTWSLGHKDWPYKPGYYHYAAPHMLICDNLLDFSHIGYVHPTTLGGTENIARDQPKVSQTDTGVRVERWLINEVPAPFHTKVAKFTSRVDRWHFYDFHVPGILIMHSGVQATGTGAPEGNLQSAIEFRSCQAVTPETTTSSHYFYAVPRNFAADDEAITDTLFNDVVAAFEEDRLMIEAQARNLKLAEGWAMGFIAADAALSRFRLLMGKRLQAENGEPVSSQQG